MSDHNCLLCKDFFNLTEKIPYSFNCCGEIICKKCS